MPKRSFMIFREMFREEALPGRSQVRDSWLDKAVKVSYRLLILHFPLILKTSNGFTLSCRVQLSELAITTSNIHRPLRKNLPVLAIYLIWVISLLNLRTCRKCVFLKRPTAALKVHLLRGLSPLSIQGPFQKSCSWNSPKTFRQNIKTFHSIVHLSIGWKYSKNLTSRRWWKLA